MRATIPPPERASYSGTFIYCVDAKGRVVLPAPFRRLLGGDGETAECVLLPSASRRSVLVISPGQWRRMEATRRHSPGFWDALGSLAAPAQIEPTTGRIMIPYALRVLLGLGPHADLVLRGIGRAVEILPREAWEAALGIEPQRSQAAGGAS